MTKGVEHPGSEFACTKRRCRFLDGALVGGKLRFEAQGIIPVEAFGWHMKRLELKKSQFRETALQNCVPCFMFAIVRLAGTTVKHRAATHAASIVHRESLLSTMNTHRAKPSPTVPTNKDTTTSKEDRQFVTALARGLEVLSGFRARDKALGNLEIAQRCKLPKSTVSRLTYTLTRLGYLTLDAESGKYRLGTATLSLGSTMLARMDIRQVARPLMQELADASKSMVSLGTRSRLSLIYVENCRSTSALTLSLDVGSRIPIATTAMGRAYLAVAGESERASIFDELAALDELAWPPLKSAIDKALEEYRSLGVACSFGDWQPDVNAIAVGIDPGGGMPLMAINCGGPAFQLSPDFLMQEVRPRLVALASQLESLMRR